MRCVVASICEAYAQHIRSPPLTEVLRYIAFNTGVQSKYVTE